MLKYRWMSIVSLMSALVLIGCASGQQETPQTEVDGPIVSQADYDPDREFSDEEVSRFAAAYMAITAIQQDYQTRMEGADAMERERLSAESDEKVEETMGDHGLTPEDYNAIAVRLPDDDQLRARVHEAIRDIEQQRIDQTQQQLETQ